MPTPLPEEVSIEPACRIHGPNADDDRPLELIRPGEDNGRHIRQDLEEVLKRRLDRREGAAVVVLDLLPPAK